MGDPEHIGASVTGIAASLERLRQLAPTAEEIARWEATRERLRRQSDSIALSVILEPICDWQTITSAAEICPDDDSADGLRWARAWRPDQPGTVLWGRTGSGKTTLLARLLARLADVDLCYSVCLTSLPKLLSELARRPAHGGYQDLLRAAGRVDVLALDDLGVGRLREGWAQHFWALLDARWQQRLPVLCTTNVNPDPAENPRLGLRYEPADEADVDRALDRLRALAPRIVRYDSPTSRRTP